MAISLPARYAEGDTVSYARDLLAFLSSPHVASIFIYHPNWVVANGPRPEWQDWWDWAAREPDRWKRIVEGSSDLDGYLQSLLSEAQSLALPRDSGDRPMDALQDGNGFLPVGMSPKKAHEVRRMSAFVGKAVREAQPETRRIVDVGAGQAGSCMPVHTSL